MLRLIIFVFSRTSSDDPSKTKILIVRVSRDLSWTQYYK
jgi:hypothetical protein